MVQMSQREWRGEKKKERKKKGVILTLRRVVFVFYSVFFKSEPFDLEDK